ncbi:serine/threonine-protein kinase [Nannocystis pusilla]|uniref:serine/threonine-protein kinase n=1 Tax=Nannocystis pusilla TaxID=889268 RepID=UPI003B7D81C8
MATPPTDGAAVSTLPTAPASDDGAAPVDDVEAVFAGLGQARRLGRYTLLELLGRGGMGVVFSAYDAELDRKSAIKFVRHTGPDSRARALLLAEAQAQARLAHPNVIPVYEVGEHGDQVFIVMEFVRGQSLRAWLKAPRRWPEIVAMFVQAGRGLSAAHQAGLIHCDFKPDNVLVGHDGRARVLDFGLARREDEPAGSAWVHAGTPGYISPERYEGAAVDARSDQFGFCVALFEALYGQRPFAGETPAALMLRIVAGEVRGAPGEAKVPARLRRAVRKGWRAPADRHPSMAALLAELGEALPRPRRAWLTVALASAALTSGAWALLLRDDAPPGVCVPAESGWGPGSRAAVEHAFAATGLPYADDAFARTARLLDAHAEAWTAARRRACELALDGPGPLDRRRERCLDRRRRELTAWIDALARADAAVVERAVGATAELPRPEACVGPEALLGGDEPELDAAAAVASAEIEGLLTEARADLLAGQYERGLPAAAAARGALAGSAWPAARPTRWCCWGSCTSTRAPARRRRPASRPRTSPPRRPGTGRGGRRRRCTWST